MEQEDKILHGAQELFFKYGLRSVTMDDIAKHLGMSKKTIYQCYKDKDEMVHTLMQNHIKQDECTFRGNYEKSENVVDEVFNIMKNMTEIFSKVNPLLFYELQKYHPKSWQLIREFKENFNRHYLATLNLHNHFLDASLYAQVKYGVQHW